MAMGAPDLDGEAGHGHRFELIDETGTGSTLVAGEVGSVSVREETALLMDIEGSGWAWGTGEAITQVIVYVIDSPVTIFDLGPGEAEFVAFTPNLGYVVRPGMSVDPKRISHLMEGRMRSMSN